jgi:hypothetical protein
MLDFRELPPIDIDEVVSGTPLAEETELPNTCSECEKELEYTYRVVIPSICSHCLQRHSMPSGAQAARNTRDMTVFVKESPPGYHWDWTTQSHVPNKTLREATTIKVGPGSYVSYGGGGFGGTSAGSSGSGGGAVGESSYTVRSGGSYSYSPLREDPRNWSPKQISDYLQQYYRPDELRDQYSILRQQLLYGEPGTYKFYGEDIPQVPKPSIPEPDILSIKLPHRADLTGREESAILIENDPKPEEREMPMEQILSRNEAEAAYKRAAAALARLKDLEDKYAPELPNGSVVAFKLTFPENRVYGYAAIKAAGLWFPSGRVHPSIPVGTGMEWTDLLSGLEQFQATDFEVLRTGGEVPELEAVRTVVLPPNAVTSAFDGVHEDEEDEDDD